MKKSLIALAALAASGLAMAQSSVTLYGVADVSLGYQSKNNDDTTGAFANGPLNNGTSRIGFRGVEDLGNGLKASFNFEQGVSLADGSSGGFQRQAWVALGGDFGLLRLGRATSPAGNARAVWDILGDPNYSVISNQFGYAGASGSRNNAQVLYVTPSFGGFSAQAAYVFEDNDYSEPDTADRNAKYELALMYENGPLAAALNYASADDWNKDRGNGVGTGKSNDAEGWELGASYDFGSFQLAASYHQGTFYGFSGNNAAFNGQDYKGASLSALVPFGAFSLGASVAYEDESDTTDALVEAKYALSNRTFIYGVYAYNEKATGKAGRIARPDDWGKDNFGIGIRHNF
ncbi:porin [Lampropedia cohaerens]|uniref:porin n=1 Tax=Lampropedia cohaerens TaxID=1610491 RepID=UPI0006993B08|nr:porin [Lampropedia cohaerens]